MEGDFMVENKKASFSMRMTPDNKETMEEFFRELGLSMSTAVMIFFEQCIIQARIPFDIKVPSGKVPEDVQIEQPENKKTALFSMRLDAHKRAQAEYTFKECGLTATEAVNLFFKACLREYGIPFRVGYPIPNAETLAAMKEADDIVAGRIPAKRYSSWEEAKADIFSEDDEGDD